MRILRRGGIGVWKVGGGGGSAGFVVVVVVVMVSCFRRRLRARDLIRRVREG